ncbi:hypothetical protein RBU49_03015 [Clostridium sp. MB40-C1]|uniref:hypothetical protein n=1 Tax=Clostridium sp. MB40-C1 TaxID=3070996 RepID=UPI0027DF5FAE|nr:hypothetical protein [Clostridium sp. MB40-C1]WMJ81241.1 hypothetical protein RBU49_03015 [Clostridium sp. MB40-C1]
MEKDKERTYFDEGQKNINKNLLKALTKITKDNNKHLEKNLNIMWNLGYQEALLLKDKEQEEFMDKLQFIDFDFIIQKIDFIKNLNVALQKDDYRDIDVKTTIIKKIIELYNYIYDEMK